MRDSIYCLKTGTVFLLHYQNKFKIICQLSLHQLFNVYLLTPAPAFLTTKISQDVCINQWQYDRDRVSSYEEDGSTQAKEGAVKTEEGGGGSRET